MQLENKQCGEAMELDLFPDNKIRKMKGVKYSELDGQWVERSRKYLFSKNFEGLQNATQ